MIHKYWKDPIISINRDQQPALGVNHTCMPSMYSVGVHVRPGSRLPPPSAGVGAGTPGGVARLSTPSGCPGAAAMATRVGAPRAAATRTGQGGRGGGAAAGGTMKAAQV